MKAYIEKVQKLGLRMDWDKVDGILDPMGDFVWYTFMHWGIDESILPKEQLIELLNKGKGSILVYSNEPPKLSLMESWPEKKDLDAKEQTIDLDKNDLVSDVKDIPGPLRAAVFYCRNHATSTSTPTTPKITRDTIEKVLLEVQDRRYLLSYCLLRLFYIQDQRAYIDCDNKLSLIFFSLLWKSLLLGEFYSKAEYYKRTPSSTDKISYDESTPFSPSIVKNYMIIQTDLKNFFEKIRVEKENDSKSTVITLDSISSKEVRSLDGMSFDTLRDLTLLIMDMTKLDLFYVTTVENVKKLGILYEKLKKLKNAIIQNSSFEGVKIPPITINEKDKILGIIVALLFKTKVLRDGMLNQKIPYEDTDMAYRYKLLQNDDNDKENGRVYNDKEDNGYWMYMRNKADYQQLGKYEFENKYLKNVQLGSDKGADYNQRVKEGIRLHFENQNFFKKVYEDRLSNKDIANYLKQVKVYSVEEMNPALLVQMVKQIVDKDKNKEEMSIESLSNLHEILHRLKEIVFKYQRDDFSAPLCFRPLFEYSFLYKQKQVDETDEDKIFFASYQSRPVNIVFLDRFCLRYEHFYQEEMGLIMNKIMQDAQEKVLQTEEKVLAVSEEVRTERGRTVQLLGIFGAFIAFVSSIVGLQKVVNNIGEYILFAATYVGCILIFVMCIFKISGQGKETEKVYNKRRIGNGLWIVYILLSLLVIVSAFFVFKDRKNGMETSIDNFTSQKIEFNNIAAVSNSLVRDMIPSSGSEQQDMNEGHLQQLTDTLPKTERDSSVLTFPRLTK